MNISDEFMEKLKDEEVETGAGKMAEMILGDVSPEHVSRHHHHHRL